MPRNLSILSYNTHLFGDGLVFPSFEDERRARAIARAIVATKADIVGLSEVWDDDLAGLIRSATGAHYFAYRPPFSVGGLKALGSGLMLLSRHPFVEASCEFQPFSHLAGWDEEADKGVAQAAIDLAVEGRPQRVLIFVTHTQASYANAPVKDEKRYEWNRQQNINTLNNLVQNTWSMDRPAHVAVLGDLNVVAENRGGAPTAEYQETVAKLEDLHDGFRLRWPTAALRPGYTYDGETNSLIPIFAPAERGWRQRIDYHFLGGRDVEGSGFEIEVLRRDFRFQAQDGKTMDLSDHYPLRSQLILG